MQTRSQRLQPVLKVAEREEDQQARAYSHQQRDLSLAAEKLAQLQSYCDEYVVSHQLSDGTYLDPGHQLTVRQFLQRLQQAISLQGEEVERHQRLCLYAKQAWLLTRQRTLSLQRLIGEYQRQEVQASEKRDQHRVDDMSGQRHAWRNSQNSELA